MSQGDVSIKVTADCGHEFNVSLVGHDPHTMELKCPECGATDHFSKEQADSIMAQYETAKVAAIEDARKLLSDSLRDATRGSKFIKFTPGR